MNDDEVSRLLEKLEREAEKHQGNTPPSWNPEPGEVLIGTLEDLNENVPLPEYDKTCDVALIRTPSGDEFSLWLSALVLREKWDTLSPQPGDALAVRFEGRRTSSTGREYKQYTVAKLERDTGERPDESSERVDEALDNFDRQVDAGDVPAPEKQQRSDIKEQVGAGNGSGEDSGDVPF